MKEGDGGENEDNCSKEDREKSNDLSFRRHTGTGGTKRVIRGQRGEGEQEKKGRLKRRKEVEREEWKEEASQ